MHVTWEIRPTSGSQPTARRSGDRRRPCSERRRELRDVPSDGHRRRRENEQDEHGGECQLSKTANHRRTADWGTHASCHCGRSGRKCICRETSGVPRHLVVRVQPLREWPRSVRTGAPAWGRPDAAPARDRPSRCGRQGHVRCAARAPPPRRNPSRVWPRIQSHAQIARDVSVRPAGRFRRGVRGRVRAEARQSSRHTSSAEPETGAHPCRHARTSTAPDP